VLFSHASQVGGLCQKHSTIPLNLATRDFALRIVDELGAERIHFGEEMDVCCCEMQQRNHNLSRSVRTDMQGDVGRYGFAVQFDHRGLGRKSER
jgi:hypothetical protein